MLVSVFDLAPYRVALIARYALQLTAFATVRKQMSGAAFALAFAVCIVHVRMQYRVVSALKSHFVVTYDCISSVL